MFKLLRLMILCNICQNFPISSAFHISIQCRLFTKWKTETHSDWFFFLVELQGNSVGKEKKYMVLSPCVLQEMEVWEGQWFYVHIQQNFSDIKTTKKLFIPIMSTWHFQHTHFRAIPLNICRKLLLEYVPQYFWNTNREPLQQSGVFTEFFMVCKEKKLIYAYSVLSHMHMHKCPSRLEHKH